MFLVLSFLRFRMFALGACCSSRCRGPCTPVGAGAVRTHDRHVVNIPPS
ncbi:hypothetical protein HMPREF1980_02035 [Actinomyces sp. oral taxon 172 str. F0311]|nr:hypothetical protein HMPREF1980_02035 [Actinomyces sp. oral taxon 172 str. F0311]